MDWEEESPRGMGGFDDDDDWADVEGTVKVGEARVEREEEKKEKKEKTVKETLTEGKREIRERKVWFGDEEMVGRETEGLGGKGEESDEEWNGREWGAEEGEEEGAGDNAWGRVVEQRGWNRAPIREEEPFRRMETFEARLRPFLFECIPGIDPEGIPEDDITIATEVILTKARLDPDIPRDFLVDNFVRGNVLPAFEGTQVEFKQGKTDVISRIYSDIERYGNAFVNTRGGILLYGVADNGRVDGVLLTRHERDTISTNSGNALNSFSPSVPPGCYRLFFFPVKIPPECDVEIPENKTLYVIVFGMFFHKTRSSANISYKNSRCLGLQRVNASTQFIAMRMMSIEPVESRPLAPGTKELDDVTKEEITALERDEKERAEQERKQAFLRDIYLFKEGLPAYAKREEIKESVLKNRVTIVIGPTGSGKSTQVPQIISECYSVTSPFRVLIAQPRRISAVSLARRVAYEMDTVPGTTVGYHVGGQPSYDDSTRFLFVTYGILKLYLEQPGFLGRFTHVILDEVHERHIDIDVCLSLLLSYISTRPAMRAIIMSATIDSNFFSEYCGRFAMMKNSANGVPNLSVTEKDDTIYSGSPWLAKTIRLEGRRFPIKTLYLDDLLPKELLDIYAPLFDIERASVNTCVRETIIGIIEKICDRIFEEKHEGKSIDPSKQSVIVFLPGIASILSVYDNLNFSRVSHHLAISTMHSSCSLDEQKMLMLPPPAGKLKVILATNIAESSLTVPDVAVVIDTCLHRQNYFDKKTRIQSLRTDWESKHSAKQRKGRSGRVQPGVCYRLVPKAFYKHSIPKHDVPEILRSPLEETVLRIVGNPMLTVEEILANCIDPPNIDSVRATIQNLCDLGVVTRQPDKSKPGSIVTLLTPLGMLLSKLPVQWGVGLFIVYAYCFGDIHPALVVAAILSREFVWKKVRAHPLFIHENMVRFSGGIRCDVVSQVNAYYWWLSEREQLNLGGVGYSSLGLNSMDPNDPKSAPVSEFKWCEANGLNLSNLREIDDLVYQLRYSLSEFGLCRMPKKSETAQRVLYRREKIEHELMGEFEDDNDFDDDMYDDGDDMYDAPNNPGQQPVTTGDADAAVKDAEKLQADHIAAEKVVRDEVILNGIDDIEGSAPKEDFTYFDLKDEELADGVKETMPGEEDIFHLDDEHESHEEFLKQANHNDPLFFWKRLKFNVSSKESMDRWLTYQTLLAGAFPDQMFETLPKRVSPEWKDVPEERLTSSVVQVIGLPPEKRETFFAQLSAAHIPYRRPSSFGPDGSFIMNMVDYNKIDHGSNNNTLSKFLVPNYSFPEGIVRMTKLKTRGMLERNVMRGLSSDESALNAICGDIILPCDKMFMNPYFSMYPQFLLRGGSIPLHIINTSLVMPLSPPLRSTTEDGSKSNFIVNDENCFTNRARPAHVRGTLKKVQTGENQRTLAKRVGIALTLFYKRDESRGQMLSCSAKNITIFPDIVRNVPEIVYMVFVRNMSYKDGMLKGYYGGSKVRKYVDVIPGELFTVLSLRTWIELCLDGIAEKIRMYPMRKNVEDSIASISDEVAAEHKLMFTTGKEAAKFLLTLLKTNSMNTTPVAVPVERRHVSETQRHFPQLDCDVEISQEEDDDDVEWGSAKKRRRMELMIVTKHVATTDL